ncbi:hypothetical protein BG000_001595, partial [Podila horticola]
MDPRLQYGQNALPHPASQSIHPSQLPLGQVLGNNYMYPATSAYTALSNGTAAPGYPSSAPSSTQMYPHQISSQVQAQAAPQVQAQLQPQAHQILQQTQYSHGQYLVNHSDPLKPMSLPGHTSSIDALAMSSYQSAPLPLPSYAPTTVVQPTYVQQQQQQQQQLLQQQHQIQTQNLQAQLQQQQIQQQQTQQQLHAPQHPQQQQHPQHVQAQYISMPSIQAQQRVSILGPAIATTQSVPLQAHTPSYP